MKSIFCLLFLISISLYITLVFLSLFNYIFSLETMPPAGASKLVSLPIELQTQLYALAILNLRKWLLIDPARVRCQAWTEQCGWKARPCCTAPVRRPAGWPCRGGSRTSGHIAHQLPAVALPIQSHTHHLYHAHMCTRLDLDLTPSKCSASKMIFITKMYLLKATWDTMQSS